MARFLYSQAAAPVTSLNAIALNPAPVLPVNGDEFDPPGYYEGHAPTRNLTWEFQIANNAPTSITVELQGSIDGTKWWTLDNSTNTAGESRNVVNKAYRHYRISITALTPNGNATLTAKLFFAP